jgi:hypothetical protein
MMRVDRLTREGSVRIRRLSALAIGLALWVCAPGHASAVTPLPSPNGACVAVNGEIETNNGRAEALAYELGATLVQTAAPGVLGVLEWPSPFGWFSRGAAYAEAAALRARQEYLATIAVQVCPPAPAGPLYR